MNLEHIARMIFGWLLFWLVAKAMPASWWCTPRGWFWWAVPHFGYYVYHPRPWWAPLEWQAAQ